MRWIWRLFQSIALESIFRSIAVAFVVIPVAFLQYRDTLVIDSQQLHFALPGLEFFASPYLLFLNGWLIIGSGVMVALGLWLRGSIFVMGLASTLFSLGTTDLRFAFSFYVPMALLAFGLKSLARSNLRLPIVFIASVYLTAAAHKLIVFPLMIDFLPLSIQQMFVGGFTEAYPDFSNFLARSFAWSVIPVEFAMGIFFLFRSTRRYAFLLASVFHSMIGTINHGGANLWEVGTSVMTIHAWVATADSKLQLKDLAKFPGRLIVLGFWCLGLIVYFGSGPGFVHQFAETMILCLPMAAIACWCYFGPFPRQDLPEPKLAMLIAFSSVMVSWGILPFIMGRTNDHIGFAMFSGGSHRTPFHCFQTKGPLGDACPLRRPRRRLPIVVRRVVQEDVVRRVVQEDVVEYCSRQRVSIEKFRDWSNLNCPDAKIDSRLYVVDPDGPGAFDFLHQ